MTAPSLKSFIAELGARNIARVSKFHVIINPPPKLGLDTNLINMWCHGASTPQSMIHTNDNYIEAGVRRKYAYDQDSSNLVLQFYVDGNYENKRFFDEWKNLAFGKNRKFNYPADYTSTAIDVKLLDAGDNDVYTYTYHNAYPKTISSIDLNYQSVGQISQFTVEFVYEYYTHQFGNESNLKPIKIDRPITGNLEYEFQTQQFDQLGNVIN